MEFGRALMVFGLLVAVIGAVIYFFGGSLSWVGHLPGDIRIEKENFSFYAPITTMILISIVISLIIRIIQYFGS